MAEFSAIISRRDDFDKWVLLPGVDVRPVRWSAGVDGGPDAAEVRLTGSADALSLAAFNLLRCGVRILNPDGLEVWAGMVWGVDLSLGGSGYSVTLDDVANRAKVLYTGLGTDGKTDSFETDWIDDDFSQAIYGIRETRVNLSGDADATMAATRAAQELRKALPQAGRGGGSGDGVTLHCVGLIRELDNRYYSYAGGRVEYEGGNTISHPIGCQVSSNQFAFSRNTRGFSSFSDDLPPIPKHSQFSVAGSLSNNGTYTVAEPAGDATQTYAATGLWFTTTDDIHDNNAGLGFLTIGQHLKVSGGLANDGQYIVDGSGADHVTVEGAGVVDEGSSSSPVSGTLTAAQRLETAEGIAADEMQNDATTFIVKVVGERVAQRFQVDGAFGALWRVGVMASVVGAPTDDLLVSVYDEATGVPGTQIDTGLLSASGVGTESEFHWVEMDGAGANTLAAATNYYVVVQRTGAFDSSSYWVIEIEEDDLYSEQALFFDGTNWATRPTAASMPFRVWSGLDTTAKMAQVIDGLRDVITAVDVADAAGVLVNPYEDGSRRGLDILDGLREMGCADGSGLVIDVIPDRRVLIRKQPASWGYQRIRIGAEDKPIFALGGAVPAGQLFVGEWAKDMNAPAQVAAIAPLTPIYIESMEYTAAEGAYQVRGEGVRSAFDLGYRNG